MPRGMNPNSRKNLKSGKNATSFTADNAAEMRTGELLKQIPKANNGGANQYQAKSTPVSNKQNFEEPPKPKAKVIKDLGFSPKQAERMQKMAENGNIPAWEKIRDTIGEKPANKMELSGSVSNPSERFASFSDDELRQAIEALQKKSGEEKG